MRIIAINMNDDVIRQSVSDILTFTLVISFDFLKIFICDSLK